MYLSELKLWNFRKYTNEDSSIDVSKPHLSVPFVKGLNVLIGENDSGKTAIIDAVKLVLKTHAYERISPSVEDFNINADCFRIELEFKDLNNEEAMHFTEWLGWDDDSQKPKLRLVYQVKKVGDTPLYADVCAGSDLDGSPIHAKAREYLKTTYLRALRDAENELTAKKNSRLSQILSGHVLFKPDADGTNRLVGLMRDANTGIKNWFNEENPPGNENEIKKSIHKFIRDFVNSNTDVAFSVSGSKIREILENLSIEIDGEVNLGLGTLNRLYMATELLHIQKTDWSGLRLCLIEELEAHLHPQAQMKVINSLQQQKEQYIISTHSPILASKINLGTSDKSQILLCKNNKVFPMGSAYTLLNEDDYQDLENFLDATKANLFFAKGLILVEGWAEEILIPAICKKLDIDLAEHEVSVINVGSTAYLRYAKIFMRRNMEQMDVKVSIITDTDVPAADDGSIDTHEEQQKQARIISQIDVTNHPDIKWNLATHWTLEWCLYKSAIVGDLFKQAVKSIHQRIFDDDATFEKELICRLRKYELTANGTKKKVASLDKVEVAYKLAALIKNDNIHDWRQSDPEGIGYLIEAIKHACRMKIIKDGNKR